MTPVNPILKWGAVAGAVVAIGGAAKFGSDMLENLVFKSHLERMECRMGKEMAGVSLIILEDQLITLRTDLRLTTAAPGQDTTSDQTQDQVELERREQTLLGKIARQEQRRDRDCDDLG